MTKKTYINGTVQTSMLKFMLMLPMENIVLLIIHMNHKAQQYTRVMEQALILILKQMKSSGMKSNLNITNEKEALKPRVSMLLLLVRTFGVVGLKPTALLKFILYTGFSILIRGHIGLFFKDLRKIRLRGEADHGCNLSNRVIRRIQQMLGF